MIGVFYIVGIIEAVEREKTAMSSELNVQVPSSAFLSVRSMHVSFCLVVPGKVIVLYHVDTGGSGGFAAAAAAVNWGL